MAKEKATLRGKSLKAQRVTRPCEIVKNSVVGGAAADSATVGVSPPSAALAAT